MDENIPIANEQANMRKFSKMQSIRDMMMLIKK
jgi:hypothetical protein